MIIKIFIHSLILFFIFLSNNSYAQYNYILDPNLSPYEIFVRYVNQQQGSQFITVDDLQKLLSE